MKNNYVNFLAKKEYVDFLMTKYSIYYEVESEQGKICFFSDDFEFYNEIYNEYFRVPPTSFFDCGCADGRVLKQAENAGVTKTYGIDTVRFFNPQNENIEIVSLQDFTPPPEKYDLLLCNGPLGYMGTEEEIYAGLQKLRFGKMVIAKHLSLEDVVRIQQNFDKDFDVSHRQSLLKSDEWWLNAFQENGFKAWIDKKRQCFVAVSE